MEPKFVGEKGMIVLSSAPVRVILELADNNRITFFLNKNNRITDYGMRSLCALLASLSSLTLRLCSRVTEAGLTELVRAQKLVCGH
jgi:hypothetical protein